jgi:hypothetical protein
LQESPQAVTPAQALNAYFIIFSKISQKIMAKHGRLVATTAASVAATFGGRAAAGAFGGRRTTSNGIVFTPF